MSIFEKFKALLKIRAFYNWFMSNYKKEMKTMDNQTKPGYKTTEFWMTVVSNLVTIVGVLNGVVPADTAAILVAALNGVYGVLRSLTKQPEITTLSK